MITLRNCSSFDFRTRPILRLQPIDFLLEERIQSLNRLEASHSGSHSNTFDTQRSTESGSIVETAPALFWFGYEFLIYPVYRCVA